MIEVLQVQEYWVCRQMLPSTTHCNDESHLFRPIRLLEVDMTGFRGVLSAITLVWDQGEYEPKFFLD